MDLVRIFQAAPLLGLLRTLTRSLGHTLTKNAVIVLPKLWFRS